MPDDIPASQRTERDIIDLFQDVDGHFQAAPGIKRKILLRQIARYDHLGPEPDTGQEHLHLGRGRVLRLV